MMANFFEISFLILFCIFWYLFFLICLHFCPFTFFALTFHSHLYFLDLVSPFWLNSLAFLVFLLECFIEIRYYCACILFCFLFNILFSAWYSRSNASSEFKIHKRTSRVPAPAPHSVVRQIQGKEKKRAEVVRHFAEPWKRNRIWWQSTRFAEKHWTRVPRKNQENQLFWRKFLAGRGWRWGKSGIEKFEVRNILKHLECFNFPCLEAQLSFGSCTRNTKRPIFRKDRISNLPWLWPKKEPRFVRWVFRPFLLCSVIF